MSQWEAKGVKQCSQCGTTRLQSGLQDGACSDTAWCASRQAVPRHIAGNWGSIQDDLQQGGAAAFEVGERRFMLVDIGRTGELVGEVAEEVLYHAPLDLSRFSAEKGFTYTSTKRKVSRG